MEGGKDLSFKDVMDMIEEFNLDSNCNKLKSKYNGQSLFEITKTARMETVHSAFLAWLFKENFENIPFNGLLSIIYKNHALQLEKLNKTNRTDDISYASEIFEKQRSIVENLKNQAIVQNAKYTISRVDTEHSVPSLSGKQNNKSKQFLDIYIECTSSASEYKPLCIVIENKVYANETEIEIQKGKEAEIKALGGETAIKANNDKNKCGQTLAYYHYFNNDEADKDIIYIYLDTSSPLEMQNAPILPKCACKAFIHISYQDIMDKILSPLKECENIDNRSKYKITEYIDCLGTTLKKNCDEENQNKNTKESLRAMALDKETKELIKNFWNEHETLIMAVLDSLSEDASTKEDTRNKIKTAVMALRSRNTDKYYFTFNGNTYNNKGKGYKKNALLFEIVKALNPTSPSQLVSEFKNILDHNNKPGVISESDLDRLSQSYKTRYKNYPESSPLIYVSNQWGIDQMDAIINWAKSRDITINTM